MKREYGGIAVEYLMVSGFGLIVGMAILGFAGKVIKEKMDSIAEKTGTQAEVEEWEW